MTDWLRATTTRMLNIENGFLRKILNEIRQFRKDFALTPLKLFFATIGSIASCYEVFKLFRDELNLGSAGTQSSSLGIFDFWDRFISFIVVSPPGKLMYFLMFTGCFCLICIVLLQYVTRNPSELRTISAYIIAGLAALFLSAWTDNLYPSELQNRASLIDFGTAWLTLGAAAIFLFIAKTQFKLVHTEVTGVQLTRVNLILIFVGVSLFSFALKTNIINV